VGQNYMSDVEPKNLDLSVEAYEAIADILNRRVKDDDTHADEVAFTISLILNLMVNRNLCVNCLMSKLLKIVEQVDNQNMLFKHTSEEEKTRMN
jgi:hypothetical protein